MHSTKDVSIGGSNNAAVYPGSEGGAPAAEGQWGFGSRDPDAVVNYTAFFKICTFFDILVKIFD